MKSIKVKRVYLKDVRLGKRFFRVHNTKKDILTDFAFEKIGINRIKSLNSFNEYDVRETDIVAVRV